MFTNKQDEDDETPKCKCGEKGEPDHKCPYIEELNPDAINECNCCVKCIRACLMDI